jgi:hypothetical protein
MREELTNPVCDAVEHRTPSLRRADIENRRAQHWCHFVGINRLDGAICDAEYRNRYRADHRICCDRRHSSDRIARPAAKSMHGPLASFPVAVADLLLRCRRRRRALGVSSAKVPASRLLVLVQTILLGQGDERFGTLLAFSRLIHIRSDLPEHRPDLEAGLTQAVKQRGGKRAARSKSSFPAPIFRITSNPKRGKARPRLLLHFWE